MAWNSSALFYKARPKNFNKSMKKPGQKRFAVSVDLTNRKYKLLKHAQETIKSNDNVSFAFADINCSLGLKFANP